MDVVESEDEDQLDPPAGQARRLASSRQRAARGPVLLVVVVGTLVGLAFALLYPPWSGGADEGTHFARAYEMAHGTLVPGEVDGRRASPIPASLRTDQNRAIRNFWGPAPFEGELLSDLLSSRPDWDELVVFETNATLAATPLSYAPSAIAMAVPVRMGWPGLVALWFGRVVNLAVYLGLAALAVYLATAFRWTLAIAALFPLNLGIAASLSPDGLTIGAFLLVVAVWTRVWRPPDVGDDDLDGRFARLRRWCATPRGTAAMVLVSGLLLALTKPPYFAILLAFPALLVGRARDRRIRAASVASLVALLVGAASVLVTSANSYQGATVGFGEPITYQPDVQQERLLSDPLGFVGRCIADWFGNLDATVQRWVRHVGYWETQLPAWVSWFAVVALVAAAMVLDRRDLLELRRFRRAIFAVGTAAMVLVLYASAYLYFDDTLEGEYMGTQIPRYSSPLFGVAVMGLAPRFVLRAPIGRPLVRRIPSWVPVAAVVVVQLVVTVAAVRTWLWTGRMPDMPGISPP
jgi:hypothetical protein